MNPKAKAILEDIIGMQNEGEQQKLRD